MLVKPHRGAAPGTAGAPAGVLRAPLTAGIASDPGDRRATAIGRPRACIWPISLEYHSLLTNADHALRIPAMAYEYREAPPAVKRLLGTVVPPPASPARCPWPAAPLRSPNHPARMAPMPPQPCVRPLKRGVVVAHGRSRCGLRRSPPHGVAEHQLPAVEHHDQADEAHARKLPRQPLVRQIPVELRRRPPRGCSAARSSAAGRGFR